MANLVGRRIYDHENVVEIDQDDNLIVDKALDRTKNITMSNLTKQMLGDNDISDIGDGTPTGAIEKLSEDISKAQMTKLDDIIIAPTQWETGNLISGTGVEYFYRFVKEVEGITDANFVAGDIVNGKFKDGWAIQSDTDKIIIWVVSKPNTALTFSIFYHQV